MQNRFAKRTDKNQKEIVRYLRSCHVQVIVTNMGDDFPDLLCGWGSEWILLEVKEVTGCIDRGQMKFLSNAIGPVAVVTNNTEAAAAVWWGEGVLLEDERNNLAAWLIQNPTQETLSVTKFRSLTSNEKQNEPLSKSGGKRRKNISSIQATEDSL